MKFHRNHEKRSSLNIFKRKSVLVEQASVGAGAGASASSRASISHTITKYESVPSSSGSASSDGTGLGSAGTNDTSATFISTNNNAASRRSQMVRKKPPPPNLELEAGRIVAECEDLPALENLHLNSPVFGQFSTNYNKHKLLHELEEPEEKDDENDKLYSSYIGTDDYNTTNESVAEEIPISKMQVSKLAGLDFSQNQIVNISEGQDFEKPAASPIQTHTMHSEIRKLKMRPKSFNFDAMKFALSNTPEQDLRMLQQRQFFVKYHVLSFLDGRMILTTNPSKKHFFCKTAPGYSVEVQRPKNATSGFRLIVRGSHDDFKRPSIIVTKQGADKGGGFVIWTLPKVVLSNEEYETKDTNAGADYWQKPIPSSRKSVNGMVRYEIQDMHNIDWLVGSIPKVKKSNLNKLKNLVDIDDETPSVSRKYDVYFSRMSKRTAEFKVKLPEPGSIRDTHEILAHFRPHETKVKKKLLKDMKRLKNKTSDKYVKHESEETNEEQWEQAEDKETVFYQPGDGILTKYTPDEVPGKFTMGWLTMYNEKVFEQPGMWELALGMTLGVGYDRMHG